jgi:mRNA-degrading endonuclease RelE of RelBE toxin-antitoxin system
MNWSASYARSVESDITKLPADLRARFISALERVLTNPFVGKKLKGSKDRYSVRMGRDFRIVYTVFKKERVVDIEFVGDRKDAYRWL